MPTRTRPELPNPNRQPPRGPITRHAYGVGLANTPRNLPFQSLGLRPHYVAHRVNHIGDGRLQLGFNRLQLCEKIKQQCIHAACPIRDLFQALAPSVVDEHYIVP